MNICQMGLMVKLNHVNTVNSPDELMQMCNNNLENYILSPIANTMSDTV